MKIVQVCFFISVVLLMFNCESNKKTGVQNPDTDLKIVGAMKNVMWKGELGGSILLDTISNKKGLYGIGPLSYLKGEILVNDGISYKSAVTSDSTMSVQKDFKITAPFFVYANVTDWKVVDLPSHVKTIPDIEKFVNDATKSFKRPFPFKLTGSISNATIHIQNLPEGSKVSSPKEAHQGQTNYKIHEEQVTIVGFFSTEHQGVFTHHDSYLHMHLITNDESKMGHLDDVEINNMQLYLPVQ